MDVNQAVQIIIGPEFEGSSFSNIPGDYGGCTRYGITQNIYNTYRDHHDLPRQSVELISLDEVTDTYKIYFWVQSGADKILAVGKEKLAFLHFNVAVQRNPVLATRMLQPLLGLVNVTGFFGPISQEACAACDEVDVVNKYLDALVQHFHDVVQKDDTQEKFLKGWMNRVTHLKAVLATI